MTGPVILGSPRADWRIVCDEFVVNVRGSREAAERRLAGIDKLGACQHPHRIEPA